MVRPQIQICEVANAETIDVSSAVIFRFTNAKNKYDLEKGVAIVSICCDSCFQRHLIPIDEATNTKLSLEGVPSVVFGPDDFLGIPVSKSKFGRSIEPFLNPQANFLRHFERFRNATKKFLEEPDLLINLMESNRALLASKVELAMHHRVRREAYSNAAEKESPSFRSPNRPMLYLVGKEPSLEAASTNNTTIPAALRTQSGLARVIEISSARSFRSD